jgi:hypothetical protein
MFFDCSLSLWSFLSVVRQPHALGLFELLLDTVYQDRKENKCPNHSPSFTFARVDRSEQRPCLPAI